MTDLAAYRVIRNNISAAALIGVAIMLVGGLLLGFINEGRYQADKVEAARVQAQIVGASITAALSFDDKHAADEYLEALEVHPGVQAVAVYDRTGDVFSSFVRGGAEPPPATVPKSQRLSGGRTRIVQPVTYDGQTIGSVLIRTTPSSPIDVLLRHGGVALLVVMGAGGLAVVGASQAALRRAMDELELRASQLAASNEELRVQIAERQRVEEALRQSQKMEAMGQLTGGIAHDFNNILMVASSGLELMERSSEPAKIERLRSGIKQALDRGASLTRQLLTFSRRSPLQPRAIDLAETIDSLGVMLDRSLREDIHVTRALPVTLWPVRADPTQLEVAILNIAVNARDAMPGGGSLTISAENVVLAEPEGLNGEFVRLSLRDAGQGIAPDKLVRVFEPFFTTKEVGKGTGLGLSQVYGFARASGGDVRVDSEVAKGTSISIFLPRSDQMPLTAVRKAATASAGAGSRGSALLVEDDAAVAEVVVGMLEQLGFEVDHAPSASAALTRLGETHDFDVVVSDMVMPGMGGMELAKLIVRDHHGLPVILATGYSESAAQARDEGFPLLIKPYTFDQLAAELNAVGARHARA